MTQQLRDTRPGVSPAMVVAVTALVVALVGMPAAYALGIGSVKTRHLAAGAVTTPKIAPDAVTADKVRAGAVGSAEIANGSVRFRDLAGRTNVAAIGSTASGVVHEVADQTTVTLPVVGASWTQRPGEVDLVLVEYQGRASAATTAFFGASVWAGDTYVGGGQGSHDFNTLWNRESFPGFEFEAQSGSAIGWVGASDTARDLRVEVVLREKGAAASTVQVKDVKVYVLRLG
jgi:hypothetical protein